MRRHQPWISKCAAVFGVIAILALALPEGFWWFLIGLILISSGICVCRR